MSIKVVTIEVLVSEDMDSKEVVQYYDGKMTFPTKGAIFGVRLAPQQKPVDADKFTAVNFPGLIEVANKELTKHHVSCDAWMDLHNGAMREWKLHDAAIYLLCAIQVQEAVVNGGFGSQP